jgi:hypothetical protein
MDARRNGFLALGKWEYLGESLSRSRRQTKQCVTGGDGKAPPQSYWPYPAPPKLQVRALAVQAALLVA